MTTNEQVQNVPFFESGYYGQIKGEEGKLFFVKMGIPISKNTNSLCSGSEYVSEQELNDFLSKKN